MAEEEAKQNGAAEETKGAPAPEKEKKEAAKAPEGKETKKKKKINKLDLGEIEGLLKETESKQGSLRSKYARELLKRKDVLSGKPE